MYQIYQNFFRSCIKNQGKIIKTLAYLILKDTLNTN